MGTEHFARLGTEHRAAVTAHMMALDKTGRELRFGTAMSDGSLAKYVAAIDFGSDIVEGAWDDNLLVGVAHLAVYREDDHRVGELGISVLTEARHRHLGQRILARTLVHARLQGLQHVNVLFLTRNRPMVRLAREFTNRVETNRGDAHATIDLRELALAAA
jgi:hypothetical protein